MRCAPRFTLLLLWSVAASSLASTPVERPGTTRLEAPPQAFERPREQWYGVYANDDKLGYMKNALRFVDADGGRFEVVNEMHLKVIAMGEKREVKSVETLTFDGRRPFRLQSGHANGKDFEARIAAGDSERVLAVADPDFAVQDVLTPELWFRQPREPGEELLVRSFSLSDLQPAIDTYTVRALKSTLVDGVPISYYEVGLHSTLAGSVGTALIDLEGILVTGRIGGAFEMRLETEQTARDFDYSADVYLLGTAEIDAALGDAGSVASLVLEVDEGDPSHLPGSVWQTVERHADGWWLLSIGPGRGEAQPASDEDVAAALRESVEHPIHDPAIRELARTAIGEAATPREKVEALVGFVDGYLADSYSAEPLTVFDILEARQGDCTEHALLFTTLARSLGIPTREVTGLIYLGDDVQAFGGHAWNEVALDGYWHPVDATWGETEINATHILLGPRSGADASVESLFGGYRLKLLEIERR